VLITYQHYHVTQHIVGTYSAGSKTKSIRPRPRRRGRSETGLVIRPRSQTPRLVYRPFKGGFTFCTSSVFLMQLSYFGETVKI